MINKYIIPLGVVGGIALGLLGVYEYPRYQMRQQVKAYLVDPGSAEFRNVEKRGRTSWCGEVNSRNSFGGMAGWTGFRTQGKHSVTFGPDWSC